jgi:7-cyano-7-deazaguanine synthase
MNGKKMKRAVVLLSGGIDSATVAALIKSQGFDVFALSIHFGQRHACELDAARKLVAQIGVTEHRILDMHLGQLGGSSLTDSRMEVPKGQISLSRNEREDAVAGKAGVQKHIANTYVPARNTIFLSLALAYAEVVGAYDIFYGANCIDYSNYPDCRPEYIDAFNKLTDLATAKGVLGQNFRIHAPLLKMTKAEIIRAGMELGVDYGLSHSCYDPIDGLACGQCDSCLLRKRGFIEAKVEDPTCYA